MSKKPSKIDISKYQLPPQLAEIAKQGTDVFIHAVAMQGPHKGYGIVAVFPREDLIEMINKLKVEYNSKQKKVALKSICKCIREVLADPKEPTLNQDFLADLALLFAMRLILKDINIITDAGLTSLMLMLDPDDSKEWKFRGMLPPALLEDLGLDDTPIIDEGGRKAN